MPTKRGRYAHQTGIDAHQTGAYAHQTGGRVYAHLTCRQVGSDDAGMSSLTLSQRTNFDGFPKPGELIEITGTSQLEASDRAILNLLYQHAHDSGRLGDKDAEWTLPLARLRFADSHKGNERVLESLRRILRVVVMVPIFGPKTG